MISLNHNRNPNKNNSEYISPTSARLPTHLNRLFSIVFLLAIWVPLAWLSFFPGYDYSFCFGHFTFSFFFAATFTSAFTFTFSRCYLVMSALRHCSAFFYEFHLFFHQNMGCAVERMILFLGAFFFFFFFSLVRVTGPRLLAGSVCGVR